MTDRLFRALVFASLVILPATAAAQSTASASTEIQRLQDEIYQAGSDLSRLRSSDANMASRLQDELDELRDEVTYLKVRLRKEGSVPRGEFTEVRDRIQALRARARGDNMRNDSTAGERRGTWSGGTSSSGTSTGSSSGTGSTSGGYGDERTNRQQTGSAIPTGQEIDVRLQDRLSSSTAQVEDRFEATTVVDLYRGNEVLIPAGSTVRGVIRTVDRATRTDRRGEMTVSFDQITVRGRNYPMRGTVTQALESDGVKGEAGRIGAGAGVGAIIGGILGGVKGALLGVLIGGGGTIAATPGRDITLEAGTVLRVRLDTPPAIR